MLENEKSQYDFGRRLPSAACPALQETPRLSLEDISFGSRRICVPEQETVVSEKGAALTKLGLLKNRMNDYYDLASSHACIRSRRSAG